MTYTKRTAPVPQINECLSVTLEQHGLAGEAGVALDVTPSLLSAGTAVDLEDGTAVWVSCIVYDRPETPQVDFLTVAIALRDGEPWVKPNSQVVATVFWHGVWPDALAALGLGMVRKALMMVALGEPQPRLPVLEPKEGEPTERDAIPLADAAARSIRTAVTAANEISAPLEDVL